MMMTPSRSLTIKLWVSPIPDERKLRWSDFVGMAGYLGYHCNPDWVHALSEGYRHRAYFVEAEKQGKVVGILPLIFMKSLLFGRFLVSLPYVNWGGVVAEDKAVAASLIDRAVRLADELKVRYLELRHEKEIAHPALNYSMRSKVQMRLPLSSSDEGTWKNLRSVVRTQIRKAKKHGFTVHWGGQELLSAFYQIFAQNMRDLGTPVFSRQLFRQILERLPEHAELCVASHQHRPVAGALAVHGPGLTEVPSASVRRAWRSTAVNSLMYWRLIQRAVERGQCVFDFGRSTIDSSTYVFKAKWGALPEPAAWQYYLRCGTAKNMRPESGKYSGLIAVWKHLPVSLTRHLGPWIVRGIP